ncbi:MAG: DegQ family serine endoprotease [candidate division KSB1 bacterium]|nr:DegQ family serine endoprotease [candidate division KSB1 bacterium]MDZ7305198.1 DegQ family serine endoprotease [candidate division KSB1 bacterium]MDZ7314293.1 DegQ family serine endoprotease [candidate division KSB1 bacterium]
MIRIHQRMGFFATVLIIALVTFFNFWLVTASKSQDKSKSPQATPGAVSGRALLQQFSAAFEEAAAKVNPSVVPIFSEQVLEEQSPFSMRDDPFRQFFGDDFFRRFFGTPPGGGERQRVRNLGSGVIVSNDGYILTNNHVVQNADRVTVMLSNQKKYTAKVIGTDPQTDVAVIKIEARNLPVATLGNSDDVRVGQWVIAVGNPFQLLHTVTAGIISAKGRSSVGLAQYEDFIQTDASINPGNSGGALADLDGNVIGINTAISSPSGGNVGIGFAIPINMAKKVMEELTSKGKVTRGYLALVPQDLDENMAKALKLKSTDGALVGDVTPDGPADKAGIKRGDIITSFNGKKVANSTQLRNMVAEAEPGSSAKVGVLRDGRDMEITVVLGERPDDGGRRRTRGEQPDEQTSKKLGLSVQTLTPELAQQFGYRNERGVIVANVESGSPADDAGLRRGDLIKEANRVEVRNVREFNQVIQDLGSGDTVAVLVRRGQNTFYAAIQIP